MIDERGRIRIIRRRRRLLGLREVEHGTLHFGLIIYLIEPGPRRGTEGVEERLRRCRLGRRMLEPERHNT